MVTNKLTSPRGKTRSRDTCTMLSEFSLPQPDTRAVIFGDMVFKLKYKLSPASVRSWNGKEHSEELVRLTKGLLKNIQQLKKEPLPIKGDHIVLFPGVTQWDLASKLLFMENGRPLTSYQNVVLIVVHVYSTSGINGRKRLLSDKENTTPNKRRRHDKPVGSDQQQPFAGLYSVLKFIVYPITKLLYWK